MALTIGEIRNRILYSDAVEELDCSGLSAADCHMIVLGGHFSPTDAVYGELDGAFEYCGHYYQFVFNVHQPKQGTAHLSNKMTSITELEETTLPSGMSIITETHDIAHNGFHKAFALYTPDNMLNRDGKALRLLMRNIVSYSREKNFIGRLRKTDKQHMKYFPMWYQ